MSAFACVQIIAGTVPGDRRHGLRPDVENGHSPGVATGRRHNEPLAVSARSPCDAWAPVPSATKTMTWKGHAWKAMKTRAQENREPASS